MTPLPEPEYPNQANGDIGMTPAVPLEVGESQPEDKLLSPDAVREMRNENTKRNLTSNYWAEIAGYMRWVTTALIGGSIYVLSSAALHIASKANFIDFTAMPTADILGALGGAMLNPFFGGIVAATLAVAAATIVISQHSRKLFVEKSFDVQDFQVQRQAALIGKAVEKAVDDPLIPGQQPKWSTHAKPAADIASWVDKTTAAETSPRSISV